MSFTRHAFTRKFFRFSRFPPGSELERAGSVPRVVHLGPLLWSAFAHHQGVRYNHGFTLTRPSRTKMSTAYIQLSANGSYHSCSTHKVEEKQKKTHTHIFQSFKVPRPTSCLPARVRIPRDRPPFLIGTDVQFRVSDL